MVLVPEASVTPHAGVDLIIVYRDDLYMVFLQDTFDECLHQQIRIAALPWTS
jgi:hypothetical protein